MQKSDVIVIGLGAMGSAATYQLAKAGARVIGIDQFSPPHSLGSTHGDSRVTRLAIGEGDAYVPLVLRSHELWREMEAETNETLLTACGVLRLMARGIDPEHHGRLKFMDRTVAAAQKFDIAYEILTADEVGARFPQFCLTGEEVAYYEPGGGLVRPETCVEVQLSLARKHGAKIQTGETMTGYHTGPDGVTVTTDKETYSAGRLVLSLGPWISRHLPQQLSQYFRVTRQTLHWYAIADHADQMTPDHCPVVLWDTDHGYFYGFPAIDGPRGGVKVASEQFDSQTDPDTVTREVSETESLDFFDSIIRGHLRYVERKVVKAVSCLYTSPPDHGFVIDWLEPDRVLVVSPCSGHGFKHSAAIGEAVAQLTTAGHSVFDLSPFSLSRF